MPKIVGINVLVNLISSKPTLQTMGKFHTDQSAPATGTYTLQGTLKVHLVNQPKKSVKYP